MEAYEVDAVRGLMKVPWPELRKKDLGAGELFMPTEALSDVIADDRSSSAQPDDTVAADVTTQTRRMLPVDKIWQDPEQLPLPKSARASSATLPRQISNSYIEQSAASSVQPAVDAFMPLYLTEELSPRFSRAKATKGYNLRRQMQAIEREAHGKDAVSEWRERGGDTGLESALAAVGLDGVAIRSRTSREVREAAEKEFEAAQHERSRIARMAKRVAGTFDVENDTWRVQIDPAVARRKAKKARRAANREERLRETAL
jgi:large subunit ribosomal protein L24